MTQTKTNDWWDRERQRFLKRILICLVLVLVLIGYFTYINWWGRTGYVDGVNFPTANCIAFVRHEADGSSAIYAVRADGSDLRRLTTANDPSNKEHPNWTPDGKSIVFSGTEADGFDQPTIDHVYEMRTDGTGLKWLTDDSNHNSAWVGEENPSWTPDGRGVIYFRNTLNESRSPPVLLNLGTKRKRVLRIKNLAGDPLWGLLGIAQVPGPAYRTITLFNPDTHRSRVFAHTDGPVEKLAWSRSGQAAVLEGRNSQWLAVYSRGGRRPSNA